MNINADELHRIKKAAEHRRKHRVFDDCIAFRHKRQCANYTRNKLLYHFCEGLCAKMIRAMADIGFVTSDSFVDWPSGYPRCPCNVFGEGAVFVFIRTLLEGKEEHSGLL